MGEEICKKDYLKAFCGFVGVILITKPNFIFRIFNDNYNDEVVDENKIYGSFLCMISAVALSLFVISVRFSNNKVNASVLDHYYYVIYCIFLG